jgi:hypothetical protein
MGLCVDGEEAWLAAVPLQDSPAKLQPPPPLLPNQTLTPTQGRRSAGRTTAGAARAATAAAATTAWYAAAAPCGHGWPGGGDASAADGLPWRDDDAAWWRLPDAFNAWANAAVGRTGTASWWRPGPGRPWRSRRRQRR